ncbi:MAG: hypothetical protein K8U57_07475 [Planctomycetes bacterium]|nr:hypothetical protein [Planctomycetota bacterium]
MVNALFENGRNNFLTGNINWTTDTIAAALLNFGTADTAVKAVTGATNASPIVLTVTAHGWAVGDIVYVDNVGGNNAANGRWKISAQATNTITLVQPDDMPGAGANSSGSGSYTSGGYAVNMGPSVAQFWNDLDGTLIGSKVSLSGESAAQGIANASSPVAFTSVPGSSTIQAVALFKDTGTPSTSRMVMLNTGKFIVNAAATASSSATSITVDPLKYAIPNGTVLYFSNGQSATLTGAASAGDRTLTVSALGGSVTQNSVALAPITGSGLPVTTASGASTVNYSFDTGVNKVFKL